MGLLAPARSRTAPRAGWCPPSGLGASATNSSSKSHPEGNTEGCEIWKRAARRRRGGAGPSRPVGVAAVAGAQGRWGPLGCQPRRIVNILEPRNVLLGDFSALFSGAFESFCLPLHEQRTGQERPRYVLSKAPPGWLCLSSASSPSRPRPRPPPSARASATGEDSSSAPLSVFAPLSLSTALALPLILPLRSLPAALPPRLSLSPSAALALPLLLPSPVARPFHSTPRSPILCGV